jgi:hypothetical protein
VLLAVVCAFPLHAADDKAKDGLPPVDPNANQITPQETAEGWKLLFDGKSLIGLRSAKPVDPLKSGWKIDRNSLVLPKNIRTQGKVTGGDLVATVAYDDFEFRFDFLLAASSNTGVLYFARGGLGQKLTGHEFQVIDDVHHPDGLKGGPIRQTGALYNILPRTGEAFVRMAERADEEYWNRGRLVVQGRRVEHWLNGQKCLEYELGPNLIRQAAAAKVKLPMGFGTKIKSPVVLLDEGEEVAWRNLKIRPLPAAAAPASTAPSPASARPGSTPPASPQRPLPTPAQNRQSIPR